MSIETQVLEIAKDAAGILIGAAAKAFTSALNGSSLNESVKAGIEHAETTLAQREIPGFVDTTDNG